MLNGVSAQHGAHLKATYNLKNRSNQSVNAISSTTTKKRTERQSNAYLFFVLDVEIV